MKVVLRVDASIHMGAGHVMRCLTLADELKRQGAECTFICRLHPGNMINIIEKRGHQVATLPEAKGEFEASPKDTVHAKWLGTDWHTDALETAQLIGDQYFDWMIVDHYALDIHWENYLRPKYKKLMVIDDLADRSHDCDLLLDQNLGRTVEDYATLIPESATALIGPTYALLRPEFAQMREKSLQRRKKSELKRLLVSMGGMDKDNATGRVLEALNSCSLSSDIQVTVVLGSKAPWLDQVKRQAATMQYQTSVLADVDHMAELMVDSDFAIGAAGSTSWERCCLGLPSVLVILAENQKNIGQALTKSGAAVVCKLDAICSELKQLLESDNIRTIMSDLKVVSSNVTQGFGSKLVSDSLVCAI